MKKVLDIFNKRKRKGSKSEFGEQFSKDAVPNSERVENSHNSNEELRNKRNTTGRHLLSGSDHLHYSNYQENEDKNDTLVRSCPQVSNSLLEGNIFSKVILDSVPKSEKRKTSLQKFSGSESSLNSTINDEVVNTKTIRQEKRIANNEKKLPRDLKKKSTYIIIKDSKHFHIGSSKTINVVQEDNFKMIETNNVNDNKNFIEASKSYKSLLDNNNVIAADDISVISLYATNWHEIGNQLGIKEKSFKHLIETNFENNSLIVESMLQQFLKVYPATTLGYICYVLQECKQFKALQQLWNYKKIS